MPLWLCSEAGAELFAGPITASTPESVRMRGSDAIAGLGDWAVSNGVLCAAVLGAQTEGQMVAGGGSLVDLGHCGRRDDQFIGLEPLYNFSQMEFLRVEGVAAQVADGEARVTTTAREGGLVLTTTVVLDRVDPTRVRVHSRLVRESDGPSFWGLGELVMHAENSLRNFAIQRSGVNEGFSHIDLDGDPYLEIGAAVRAISSLALVGHDAQGPPIAYGYRITRLERVTANGIREPLDQFALTMDSVSLVQLFPEPLWLPSDELGVLQAVQVPFMDLELGASLHFEREIRVSPHSDVASVSAAPAADAVSVTGSVDDPDARVHFDRLDSEAEAFSPITMVRPAAEGRFELQLSAGHYRVRVLAPGNRALERTFDVAANASPVHLAAFELPRLARVELPHGGPMRLVFTGLGDTPDPRFGDDLTGATVGHEPRVNDNQSSDVHLAGVASDPEFVALAPGHYRVYATRGPEFGVTTADLKVRAGDARRLEIAAPQRELETPGWISADFHVHASASFDSTLPPRRRVSTFVAEGGEIIVSSDHDVVSDYAPIIDEMGLGDRLRSVSGVEVTSISHTAETPHSGGHINVYPVPHLPQQTRGGALRGEGLRLRGLIAQARALPAPAIVQLNHPRDAVGDEHDGSYFEHLAAIGEPYDSEQPLSAEPNRILLEADPGTGMRDIDFDAIELLNGGKLDEYALVRRDWFSLLRQGRRITAMANSDTHELSRVAGVPRTYVRAADDRILAFDSGALIDSVRAGACFGTSGPLLDVTLGDARPGDHHTGDRGRLRVDVRAATWVPVSTVRVYINGEPTHEISIDRPQTIEVDLRFESDSFATVEVTGEASDVYAAVLPGFHPVAFSNPVYIDADADGIWTPPGPYAAP